MQKKQIIRDDGRYVLLYSFPDTDVKTDRGVCQTMQPECKDEVRKPDSKSKGADA